MKLTLASMLVLAFALAPAYAADSAPAANPPADSSGDTATPAAATTPRPAKNRRRVNIFCSAIKAPS